jgi:hypothetical protein
MSQIFFFSFFFSSPRRGARLADEPALRAPVVVRAARVGGVHSSVSGREPESRHWYSKEEEEKGEREEEKMKGRKKRQKEKREEGTPNFFSREV